MVGRVLAKDEVGVRFSLSALVVSLLDRKGHFKGLDSIGV